MAKRKKNRVTKRRVQRRRRRSNGLGDRMRFKGDQPYLIEDGEEVPNPDYVYEDQGSDSEAEEERVSYEDGNWDKQVDIALRKTDGMRKRACRTVMNRASKLLGPKSKSTVPMQKLAMKAYQRAFVGKCARGEKLLKLAVTKRHKD